MKTYYELLTIDPGAAPDEIKKAFRREIAKYHPDKVQHLGREFQEMAAGIAADLTEAYRVLMDPALRAKYDEELREPDTRRTPPPAPPPAERATTEPPPRAAEPRPAPGHERSSAGDELVRKATLSRVRDAIACVVDTDASPAPGFDAGYVTKARKGLFKKSDPPVRLLLKFVPQVTGESIAAVWPQALKVSKPETIPVVLLMGSRLAPASELAGSVAEQRRRSRGAGPVLVPVDVRDWDALFPPDTPAAVRSVLEHLRVAR